jgi:HlyD family secretion protein
MKLRKELIMRRRLLTLTLILIACGAAAEVLYAVSHRASALQIVTAPLTRGAVVSSVTATGTVQAVDNINVGTQVTGTIKELDADFNSIVHVGQVLARLDDATFQASALSARATVEKAKDDVETYRVEAEDAHRQLERAEALQAHDQIPPSDLEDAVVTAEQANSQVKSALTVVTQAQAALGRAEQDLRNTIITSPVSGTVLARNVDVGQTVVSSAQVSTLFLIASDLTQLRVLANVDESDISRVHEGMAARFEVEAYPGRPFPGTVSTIRLQPVQDQNVVTYTTVVDVDNRQLAIRPGMTATVTFETTRRDDVLRVPVSALRFTPPPEVFAALGQKVPPEASDSAAAAVARRVASLGSSATVWTIANGRLVPAIIKLGLVDSANAEVARGNVSEGTPIATGVASMAVAASGSPLAGTPARGPVR